MSETPGAPREWIRLAQLLRPQGRKGELLAELLTDFPDRFDNDARVFLAPSNFAGSEAEARLIHVVGHWLPVGRNHGRIVLSLAGITSISQAEELSGLEIIVPASERLELDDEDTEYISDLVGCLVYDGTNLVGSVTGVEFPSTADGTRRLPDAAPLLTVLTDAGDEVLIPYVKSFLVSVSVEQQRIEMNLPRGLLELNRSDETPR